MSWKGPTLMQVKRDGAFAVRRRGRRILAGRTPDMNHDTCSQREQTS